MPIATHQASTTPSRAEAIDLLRALNNRAGGHRPCHVDRPLACYGAGSLGKLARSHLEAVGVPLAFVVDANAARARDDPDWAGVAVLAPEEVPADVKSSVLLAISVVTSPLAPLHAQLTAGGWSLCIPFYDIAESFRTVHPLRNGWFADPLDSLHLSLCEAVLHRWGDSASRAHHLRFAAWRLAREEWNFDDAPVDPASRFFVPEISARLSRGERILDGGAHHGSYLARVLATTGGEFQQAWAVEPDPANRSALAAWATSLPQAAADKLTIHDAVLGSCTEPVHFHAGLGYASQIAATGREVRLTQTIDSMDISPTLIKLHLEGSELAALQGARDTLDRCRPIIMATVYHNDDGLARTADWLMGNLDAYRVLMRTHGWCGTGAVIYALPQERMAA